MLYITDVLPYCLIFPSMLFLSLANIPRSRLTFNFRDNAFGCISTCNTSTSSVAVPAHSGVVYDPAGHALPLPELLYYLYAFLSA